MPSISVNSFDRTAGPMSRTSNHYDEYFSPTSPVGKVRAERVKYLVGVQDRLADGWGRAEQLDPSSGTIVDPDHENEGAQLLLNYYEAVRRDRHRHKAAVAIVFFGIGGLSALLGWLISSPLVTVWGICFAIFTTYQTLTGQVAFRSQAKATKRAFESSGYFRAREILDGYLITTHSAAAVWEATDLEHQRRTAEYDANRLRQYPHLTHHRETELIQLQNREQELRRQIVDMLDDYGTVEVKS